MKTIEIEAKGFTDLCNKIKKLENENTQLQADNKVLGNELTYFKEYSADLETELTDIKAMSMFEFGNKYCSGESLEADGHALAKSLLGGA